MLVLLQFDASSLAVIEEMMLEGRLPALASMRARGKWSTLEAETDLFEAGTYPTLYTGVPIPEHGLYYPFVWFPAEQRLHYMDRLAKPESVWERLGRAGRRSIVIDPYQLWATRETPGFSISGWQYRHNIIPKWATPRQTYRRLVANYGKPPTLADAAGRRTAATLLDMRRDLLHGAVRAATATVDLIGSESPDFVWVSFIGAHQAGHHLWDTSMLEGEIDGETRRAVETSLKDIYEEIDRAIGRIMEALPAGADVIAFSSLGMGPNTTRSDFLPDMLNAVLGRGVRAQQDRSAAGSSIWSFRARIPSGTRAMIGRMLPTSMVHESVARLYLRGMDWKSTRAFALPGDHFGYVRLNVQGREREGIVPEREVEGLLDELIDGLTSFNDPDGSPSIGSIERITESNFGEKAPQLPDFVIRWSDRPSARIRRLHSPRFGEIMRRGVGIGRSGNHAEGTWSLLLPGSSAIRPLERPPHIIDMAATASALLEADGSGLSGESLFTR